MPGMCFTWFGPRPPPPTVLWNRVACYLLLREVKSLAQSEAAGGVSHCPKGHPLSHLELSQCALVEARS